MSGITPYTPQSIFPVAPADGRRLARATSRQLAAIDHSAEIRTASVAAEADIQQSKVDAVARTGGYAMQQAALLSNMQQQLALAAPTASGDIDYIKTVAMLGIGEVVADTVRRVNRR